MAYILHVCILLHALSFNNEYLMNKEKMSTLPVVKQLSSLKTTVICLVILAMLVLWGTVYQVDHGIYEAKERFFNAWMLFIYGIIPFPAVRLTVSLLICNLLCTLLFRQVWSVKKIGIILTHVGILILLVGGGYISYTAKESFLTLYENESSNESSSYHKWEIAIGKTIPAEAGADSRLYERFDLASIQTGKSITSRILEGTATVNKVFQNCRAFYASSEADSPGENRTSISIVEEPVSRDPAQSVPGIILSVNNSNITLYGGNPAPTPVFTGKDTAYFILQQKRMPLPLTVKLLDFVKVNYPGTAIAKDYKSVIHVNGRDLDRDVVVSMNRPFRYKNRTFYQAAFSIEDSQESTTLAVVENSGKSLPYLASLLISAGLLAHFLMKLFLFLKKRGAGLE